MSQSSTPSVTAPPMPSILRFLYVHNPFYLISVCCVLYGIKSAFRPGDVDYIDPWALMSVLCGFTSVMAITAYLVVRIGKVWEDARSIALSLLLLFVAISISFDELINLRPEDAPALLTFAFAFVVLISEAVFRGLRIRLPALFRVPFHAFLALFFFAPLWVSPVSNGLSTLAVRERIAAFPALAGLLALTLLPAIHRGRQYVRENGTPWSWPLYPWSLFFFVACAVIGRSYALSISFDPLEGLDSAFGLYLLIPFFLAVFVLLLEMSIVEQCPALRRFVLFAAPLLLVLAQPPLHSSLAFDSVREHLTQRFGSPVYLTALSLSLLYAMGWVRGVRGAELGMNLMLVLTAAVGEPESAALREDAWLFWPLAVVAVTQAWFAAQRGSSLRAFAAGAVLLLALRQLQWPSALDASTDPVSLHAVLALGLVIGLTFRDRFAECLRAATALALPLLSLAALLQYHAGTLNLLPAILYVGGLTVVAGVLWWWTVLRWYQLALAALLALELSALSAVGFWALQQHIGLPAAAALSGGTLSFALAALISARKAGRLRRDRRATAV